MRKLKGALSIASNSYGISTGYGQQVKMLIDRLVRAGMDVACLSNFGLEGSIQKGKTPFGTFQHYPKGLKPYSDDVIPVWHEHFMSTVGDKPNALFTLYDQWVYRDMKFDGDWIAYTPLDHVTAPPKVVEVVQRENVDVVTMAPHGKRQMDKLGIQNTYIPHSVDTSIFKPTKNIRGRPARERLEVPDNAFLVTMVAANKANSVTHRKAFAEAFMAFSMFKQSHPDAYLYLHTNPSNIHGGFKIPNLLKAVGLDDECVRIANLDDIRVGYPEKELAAIYTASDVLLAPSLGEGFGVPIIEAQAAGTRVITSNWTAPQDLAGPDSYLIDGQPFWDEPGQAFYYVPLIASMVPALEAAYEAERGVSEASIEWAKQFDVERVWNDGWLPFFEERFG